MVTNALRAYLQLATGLTEVTKQKATDAAKQLSAQLGVQGDEAIATAGAVASIASQQIQILTEDLLAAAKSNRKLLSDLVQLEVDRGASQLAKLDPQQLDGLLAAVRRLADEIANLTGVSRSKAAAPSAGTAAANRSTATDARPLAAKKATKATKKTAASPAASTSTAGRATVGKKPPVKKVPSKKATSAKVPAKKVPAKKPAAKAPSVPTPPKPAHVAPSPKPADAAPVASEPVLELMPEQVIELNPEPRIDPMIETESRPVPPPRITNAESSPESTL